ncbi:MAG: quinoprotein dehydrogenase-associated putative ABC transporter substrate-binding protein [Gemmatimonadales bacterium]|nr:quinoprotein dehydrogenase-associated putative ABC transporter substrate-binding protein [Gemmatimonadales bacterium]
MPLRLPRAPVSVPLVTAAILALAFTPTPTAAQATRELRVCADPNNLPFSNERREGFENRIAELLAAELHAKLSYTWAPQWRGFIRKTLGSGECDVVMGVPSDFELAQPTDAYYRSTYVFVSRRDGPSIHSLDDPALRRVRVGVHLIGDDYTNTPPAHALANRGIVDNVAGYPIYGDYSKANPPARIIEAVASGEIDVAMVWGPFAGYFAPRQSVPLRIVPVSPEVDPPALPFTFAISLGVRKGDDRLRGELDEVLRRRRIEIRKILDRYGVPQPAAAVGVR